MHILDGQSGEKWAHSLRSILRWLLGLQMSERDSWHTGNHGDYQVKELAPGYYNPQLLAISVAFWMCSGTGLRLRKGLSQWLTPSMCSFFHLWVTRPKRWYLGTTSHHYPLPSSIQMQWQFKLVGWSISHNDTMMILRFMIWKTEFLRNECQNSDSNYASGRKEMECAGARQALLLAVSNASLRSGTELTS